MSDLPAIVDDELPKPYRGRFADQFPEDEFDFGYLNGEACYLKKGTFEALGKLGKLGTSGSPAELMSTPSKFKSMDTIDYPEDYVNLDQVLAIVDFHSELSFRGKRWGDIDAIRNALEDLRRD